MPQPRLGDGTALCPVTGKGYDVSSLVARFLESSAWIVGGMVAASALCWLLVPWLGHRAFYTPYLPVILAAAMFRNARAAIIATIVAIILSNVIAGMPVSYSGRLMGVAVFAVVTTALVILARQIVKRRDVAIADRQAASRQAVNAQLMVDELTLLIDAASNHAIYFLDRDGIITLWSPSATRVSGWKSEEVIGKSFDMFCTDADRRAGKPQQALAVARELGRIRTRGTRIRKDGSSFLAEITLTALFDPSGDLRGFGKVLQDVSEEARASEALELRERQLRSILATVPEATVVTDSTGRIVSFSRIAQSMFGYAEADIIGCQASMLLATQDEDPANEGRAFARLAELGPRRDAGRRADGTTFPIEITVGRASVGNNVQFTGFIRDLTSEMATRARLASLQAQLVHLSRASAMGTMAATLAHELNQPLAAVESYVGAARNILSTSTTDAAVELDGALAGASAQALRAATIIRRTREMLSTGDVEFAHEDLESLILEAHQLAGLDRHRPGIAYDLALEPDLGSVLADRIQIQQVILNLLRNAADAVGNAPVRCICLSATIRDAEFAEITVSDSGKGFNLGDQPRLFDAFYTTKADGLGVGLSICRTIVEAHGGRIWTDLPPGGGTKFHFTLRRSDRGERTWSQRALYTSSTTTKRSATR